MARPLTLSAEVQARLVQAFELGQTSIESACAYAGISHQTYYNWLKRGRAGEGGFVEFLEAVEKARADAVIINLGVIRKAAMSGHWQAAAWWLERVLPRQYGRKVTVETITRDALLAEIERLEGELALNDDRS